MKDYKGEIIVATILGLIGIVLIGVMMWGMPKYKIYRQNYKGQANLRQQEWEKQILIERAKGVAEANKIIGDSLKDNEEYLKYLMIDTLKDYDDFWGNKDMYFWKMAYKVFKKVIPIK